MKLLWDNGFKSKKKITHYINWWLTLLWRYYTDNRLGESLGTMITDVNIKWCFYLISLFGENYFCAFFPSRFHIYSQDLVFNTGCVSILIHNLSNKWINVFHSACVVGPCFNLLVNLSPLTLEFSASSDICMNYVCSSKLWEKQESSLTCSSPYPAGYLNLFCASVVEIIQGQVKVSLYMRVLRLHHSGLQAAELKWCTICVEV